VGSVRKNLRASAPHYGLTTRHKFGAAGWPDAVCEVILAAGVVVSPHLPQLTGVGDPEVLTKAGITVRHALPGVGKNFDDHYIARMSCEVQGIER